MVGYIYKTTNLIDGKFYIGQKKSNKFLHEKYLGSGKRLKEAIRKYGKENFKVELLEEVNNILEMDKREIYWINFYSATNKEIGYNLSEGGNVNRTLIGEHNGFFGKKHSKETRKHLSDNWHLNHKIRKWTEEERNRMSQKMKGRIITEEAIEKLKQNAKTNPNYGMRGKHISEETRLKLSQAKKGIPNKKAQGSIHITNDVEDKMIRPEELDSYIKLGWRRGRKRFSAEACANISRGHLGHMAHNKGKIWVTNGTINKTILKEELECYLKLNYKLGKTQKRF